MYKNLLLLIALVFGFGSAAFAQDHNHDHTSICGTVGEYAEMVTERLLENQAAIRAGKLPQGRDIEYVPIRFHLVGQNNGNGRVSESRVFDQLCALNDDYEETDIQFYLSEGSNGSLFSYINNDNVYANPGLPASGLFMSQARVNNAINVYICNNATPPGGSGLGVTLGYYDPSRDWVVIRKGDVGFGEPTLPHEIGHFLSLPHPHNGWDAGPADDGIAPAISPGGVQTERADGANCATAGDFICDTPADYNGFGWDGCNYNGGWQDPTGASLDPEEKLFMGYYLDCPRDEYFFSDDQIDLMVMDLYSSGRDYIRPGITPNLTAVTTAPALALPENASVVAGYEEVYIDWNSIPGVDYYMLEIDNLPTFSTANLQKLFLTESQITMELEASKNYFWRVTAFNAYSTCGGVSSSRSFQTNSVAVSTQEIEEISAWTVFPNPTAGNDEVNIYISAANAFQANINLTDINGKLVSALGQHTLTGGENSLIISVANLPQGVYNLTLTSEEGITNKRIVVSK